MSHPTFLPKVKHTATIIFLHGLGDTGHGWLDALSQIAMPYVKIICPNAPVNRVTLNAGMRMPSWFDIKSLTFTGDEDEAGIKQSAEFTKQLIENEVKNGISSERIVIGGFSQGGAAAMHAFFTYERKLGGFIGLSTFLPLHSQFPKNCKKENKDTQIFLGHGDFDPVVNIKFGHMTHEVLQTYYTNHVFHKYEGLGHSSNSRETKDMKQFFLKTLPSV